MWHWQESKVVVWLGLKEAQKIAGDDVLLVDFTTPRTKIDDLMDAAIADVRANEAARKNPKHLRGGL